MKKLITTTLSILAIAMSARAQVAAYVPTNGLKAWYPFNATTNDQSGMGNHLTGSVNYVADRFGVAGTAISGFTQSAPLSCGAPNFIFGYDSAFTTAVWVNFYGASGTGGLIMKHGITTALASDFVWHMAGTAGGNPTFATSVTSPWTFDTYSSALPMNSWQHLVAVYNIGAMKLYLNGVLVATQTLAASPSATSNQQPFWIGYDQWNNTVMDSTTLDDIGVWNRALADCEIAKLYFSTTTLITSASANDTVLAGGTAHYSIADTGGSATYQWQQDAGTGFTNLTNSGPYSGVTTKNLSISPVTPAMHNYQYRCLRNGAPCSDTSAAARLVVNTVGISNIDGKNRVEIYPNPAQDQITVSTATPLTSLTIFDIVGQKALQLHDLSTTIDIDISRLTAGVYFIKADGTFAGKFLKE